MVKIVAVEIYKGRSVTGVFQQRFRHIGESIKVDDGVWARARPESEILRQAGHGGSKGVSCTIKALWARDAVSLGLDPDQPYIMVT